jgi:proton-translocating NADH-quinone oxidoreductase chain N
MWYVPSLDIRQFVSPFDAELVAILPEIFLFMSALWLLVYGAWFSTSKQHGNPVVVNHLGWLGVFTLAWTFILVVSNPYPSIGVIHDSFFFDESTRFLQSLILIGAAACILMAFDYFRQEQLNSFEYILLVLLSTGGMLCLVASYDLISMYLALELQSLCLYVLASIKRHSPWGTEAGLKYFLLGAFSSGIFLFGSSLIYGFSGTTRLDELAKLWVGVSETSWLASTGMILGMVFLVVGMLFKLTAAPFHMWAPDVYEGAPTSVTAFFAIVPKVAMLGLLIRWGWTGFYEFWAPLHVLIVVCSFASLLIGSLAAMAQRKVKRLLAYSSIGHVGYLLMGFACGTLEGLQGMLLYTLIYVTLLINVFSLVLSLHRTESQGWRVKYLEDFSMLSKTQPVFAFTFAMILFSMAGIPPLAGFCGKFSLFWAALGSSLYSLAVLGVLTSVISCFYYIRFIKIMYFKPTPKWISYDQMDREKSVLIALTLAFNLFFFLDPSPWFVVTHHAALALCL